MQELRIGDAYRLVPSAFTEERHHTGQAYTGRIVYINRRHRFFTVAFTVNGVELKESIKF